ncbi:MAG: thiol-disulfide oxidoreductase DCC family protein [Gemmatimonadota bacterium]
MTNGRRVSREAVRCVVYDADCGLCRTFVRAVRRRRTGAFEFRTQPDPAAEEILVVEPDGRVLGGIEALGAILRQDPRTALIGRWLTLPGIRRVGAAGYRWVARRRRELSRWLRLAGRPNLEGDPEYEVGSDCAAIHAAAHPHPPAPETPCC